MQVVREGGEFGGGRLGVKGSIGGGAVEVMTSEVDSAIRLEERVASPRLEAVEAWPHSDRRRRRRRCAGCRRGGRLLR